ncbi:MAG: hypothetical protein RRX92_05240 [Lachnospiraceae bacterium]
MSMPVIIPSTITVTQAISDMIESVAMEESGLSHILNAEGEKIQKIATMSDVTPEQLLAVNDSVQATVDAISYLEIILQGKLKLFQCSYCRIN